MLIKSFISREQARELLLWSSSQDIRKNKAIGQHGFYSTLDSLQKPPSSINPIRSRCLQIVGGIYQEPVYKDLIVEVAPSGFIAEHTDPTFLGLKHLRCNIMIQKPEIGGVIHINYKPVHMDIGDMVIIDTSITHSISEVQGAKSYVGLAFGFLC